MRRAACVSLIALTLTATAGIVAMLAPGVIRAAGDSPTPPDDLSDLALNAHPGARLPLRSRMIDENGGAVALGAFFGKTPVIVVLEYLRCTSLCGVTLQNLVATLDRLPLEPKRDYQLVAISIDPRDGPADAAAARDKYSGLLHHNGGADGMHFLTGPVSAVREIANTIGFAYRYDALADAYIHPAGFVIASPNGVISRYVENIAVAPDELLRTIAAAEEEKPQGPLDRLLLLCHVQGAPLGRLTIPVLAAFTAANLAAALAVIATFAAIRRRRYN